MLGIYNMPINGDGSGGPELAGIQYVSFSRVSETYSFINNGMIVLMAAMLIATIVLKMGQRNGRSENKNVRIVSYVLTCLASLFTSLALILPMGLWRGEENFTWSLGAFMYLALLFSMFLGIHLLSASRYLDDDSSDIENSTSDTDDTHEKMAPWVEREEKVIREYVSMLTRDNISHRYDHVRDATSDDMIQFNSTRQKVQDARYKASNGTGTVEDYTREVEALEGLWDTIKSGVKE